MAEPMDVDQDELASTNAVAPQVAANPTAESSLAATEGICNTFTPFPRLPLEMRDMIWDFAVPGFRVFIVEDRSLSQARLEPKSRAAAVPGMLHANKESRRVALKTLEPFAGRWGKPIYFNFKNDVLRVRGLRALATLCGAYYRLSINFKKHFPLDVREWHVKLRHIEISGFAGIASDTAAFQWIKSLKTLAVGKQSAVTLHEKEIAQEELHSELAEHWLGPTNKLPEITVFTTSH